MWNGLRKMETANRQDIVDTLGSVLLNLAGFIRNSFVSK